LRVVEAVLLLIATLVFSIFCIAPLQSMQGNPAQQAELGVLAGESPPPTWMLPFDDSYIFIRYAQQAHRGHAFQWTTGEPSSGASSFLYPWLLLPGQWLGDDIATWSWWSRGIGILGLWLLGLVTVSLMRSLDLADPWPLATGLAVAWSGPVGFGALSGMESALNAAALLLTVSLWIRVSKVHRMPAAIVLFLLLSILPCLRPENLLLTLLGALAILALPRAPLPRSTAPLILLPGLAVALLNLTLTGLAQPTAVVTKSWLGIAFPDLVTLIKLYLLGLWTEIVPVYVGGRGFLLWPPVGIAALATAATALWSIRRDLSTRGHASAAAPPTPRDLLPLATVWLVLVALSPMSSMPTWQGMRHHHSGLVCAWILAFAGTALLSGRLSGERAVARRWLGLLSFAPAALLLTFIPTWGGLYAEKAIEIHHRHGPAARWLADQKRDFVLLLNDAGLLSLAHDGPAIDVMGLGTPEFAQAYRHGAGSMVEAIARRQPPPVVAAANLDVFRLADLLAKPLLEGLNPANQTLLAEIDLQLLDHTVLDSGVGVDFAHLAGEALVEIRWQPAPDPYRASLALELPGVDGDLELQGCRPLSGGVEVEVPQGVSAARLTAATLTDRPAELRLRGVGAGGADIHQTLEPRRWNELPVDLTAGAVGLRIEVPAEAPPVCLESLSFD
jgi:hypothetical protein